MGLIYKIRHLTPSSAVRSLYFSIFNSHVSYGIAAWGNASQVDINKIISLQNKAGTEITCIPKGIKPNIYHDYYNLNILNIHDQFKVQLSPLMWNYDHNTLPYSLTEGFRRSNLVHNYITRYAAKGKLYYYIVNTSTYGINSFKNQGAKILNTLKDLNIYIIILIATQHL